MEIRIERMSDEFTKYHLLGLPRSIVLHHFTDRDKGSPHDHPWGFKSIVLFGGYTERVYHMTEDKKVWWTEEIERREGDIFEIDAEHVHELIHLPQGQCLTSVFPRWEKREWGFWTFDLNGAHFEKAEKQE